jgi:hypothetical protein
VELGEDGVLQIIVPTLTRQEQTRLDNSYQRAAISSQTRKN